MKREIISNSYILTMLYQQSRHQNFGLFQRLKLQKRKASEWTDVAFSSEGMAKERS